MFQRLEIGVKLKIKESTSQFLGTKTKRTISFSQGIIEFAQVKLHVKHVVASCLQLLVIQAPVSASF